MSLGANNLTTFFNEYAIRPLPTHRPRSHDVQQISIG
jgi:hypothetical protein